VLSTGSGSCTRKVSSQTASGMRLHHACAEPQDCLVSTATVIASNEQQVGAGCWIRRSLVDVAHRRDLRRHQARRRVRARALQYARIEVARIRVGEESVARKPSAIAPTRSQDGVVDERKLVDPGGKWIDDACVSSRCGEDHHINAYARPTACGAWSI